MKNNTHLNSGTFSFDFSYERKKLKAKTAIILALSILLSCIPYTAFSISAMTLPENRSNGLYYGNTSGDASGDASGDPSDICRNGHIFTSKWYFDSTHHWHSCIRCGTKIDAANHTGGKATCVSKAICSVCNAYYGEINVNNHSFTKYTSNNDATCTKDGTKTAKCDRCSAVSTVTDIGSAKGHTPSNWTTVKEATYREGGIKAIICKDCLTVLKTEDIPKKINPFTDMKESAWYFDACMWNYDNAYMSGTGNNVFSPNSNLTRAQFVQIIAKIDGVNLSAVTYSGKFSDVKSKDWFAKAVQWACDNGITGGTGSGKFSPNNMVTREQLATFIMAYASYLGYDTKNSVSLSKYKDASKVSTWATDSVKWVVAEGLISGTSSNTLSPKSAATRAQVAVIVKNFVENFLKK